MARSTDRVERLATAVMEALDIEPATSQQQLAARLKKSGSEVALALKLLEQRGLIVRETTPGGVSKSIRLVEARNELVRRISSERHLSPTEVAALVARGDMTVTASFVIVRRQNKEVI